MEIGENLKVIREQKNISQKQLSIDSGVGIATIQRIEYGQLHPKQTTLHKIAKALGVEDMELDDHLKEMVSRWNSQIDVESLTRETALFDTLPNYDSEDIETFRQFLSLNPDGKQKASEYIEFLMQKQEK